MSNCASWQLAAGEIIPTRQSLLSRLKDWGDQESWNDFFTTYWRLIYGAAKQAGLSDDEAQDVVQETVIAVCKSMPSFRYDAQAGSFKAWLWQLTQWRIRDQFRKRLPRHGRVHAADQPPPTDLLEQVPDPAGDALEAVWNAEWDNNLLQAATERVRRQVDPKQFQLFDLYVLQRWPVQRICDWLKVRPSRVYLAKHRISRLIKRQLNDLIKKGF